MVESIARVEWIRRNVFDVGGSSTDSERIGKHLKRRRGEGVETENAVWRRRTAVPVEQRKLVRIQVITSIWGLACVVTHSLTWTSYLSDEWEWRSMSVRRMMTRDVAMMNIALCSDKLVTLTAPVNYIIVI